MIEPEEVDSIKRFAEAPVSLESRSVTRRSPEFGPEEDFLGSA